MLDIRSSIFVAAASHYRLYFDASFESSPGLAARVFSSEGGAEVLATKPPALPPLARGAENIMFTRKDIRPGLWMELDASGVGPALVKMPAPPRPVRYGDALDPPSPNFSEVSQKLDAAKKRLEKLVKDFHNARG